MVGPYGDELVGAGEQVGGGVAVVAGVDEVVAFAAHAVAEEGDEVGRSDAVHGAGAGEEDDGSVAAGLVEEVGGGVLGGAEERQVGQWRHGGGEDEDGCEYRDEDAAGPGSRHDHRLVSNH